MFLCRLGVKNEEQESKTARKGGGVGKKGRKRLQTNPSILKTAHLDCHAWVYSTTFDAVISCHNWPIKCLSFRGAEMNLEVRVWNANNSFVFWNAWTALMKKSQWIRMINAGQRSSRQNGLPFSPLHRQLECSSKSGWEQSSPRGRH